MAGSRSELVKRFEVRSPLEPAGKMSRDARRRGAHTGVPRGEPSRGVRGPAPAVPSPTAHRLLRERDGSRAAERAAASARGASSKAPQTSCRGSLLDSSAAARFLAPPPITPQLVEAGANRQLDQDRPRLLGQVATHPDPQQGLLDRVPGSRLGTEDRAGSPQHGRDVVRDVLVELCGVDPVSGGPAGRDTPAGVAGVVVVSKRELPPLTFVKLHV